MINLLPVRKLQKAESLRKKASAGPTASRRAFAVHCCPLEARPGIEAGASGSGGEPEALTPEGGGQEADSLDLRSELQPHRPPSYF